MSRGAYSRVEREGRKEESATVDGRHMVLLLKYFRLSRRSHFGVHLVLKGKYPKRRYTQQSHSQPHNPIQYSSVAALIHVQRQSVAHNWSAELKLRLLLSFKLPLFQLGLSGATNPLVRLRPDFRTDRCRVFAPCLFLPSSHGFLHPDLHPLSCALVCSQ